MCVSLFSKSKIFGRKREQFSKRIFKFCCDVDVDASNDVTPTNVSKLKVGSGRSSKLWPTGLNPSTVIYDALGIRVWGCKMEGADKSTRQWALTQAVGRNKFCAIYKWPALIDWYLHNAILIRWPLINNVNTFRHCLGGKCFGSVVTWNWARRVTMKERNWPTDGHWKKSFFAKTIDKPPTLHYVTFSLLSRCL